MTVPTELAPPPEDLYFAFTGPVNAAVAQKFFGCFTAATQRGAKRVHLLIHSLGGDVGDGIAIYSLLKSLSPLEIITYNGGQVASIAVLIFLAGRVRRTSKLANFVIHKSTASFPGPATADDMEAGIRVARHNDKVIESVLREELKMPQDKWDVHAARNLTITADEAVQFALVHEIAEYHVPPGNQCYNIA